MRERIVLDTYCGDGGAGAGYARAGFRVIGVDKEDHTEPGSTTKAGDDD